MSKNQHDAIKHAALEHTLKIAEVAEQQLDEAIHHFDNMSKDEIADLRKKRRGQLEEKKKMRDEWIRLGHGKYQEIADEKQWFEEAKTNKHLITHFYRASTTFCQVVDYHLEKLAAKHIETRFIKIDAEKCAYLVEKLNIRIMPTIIMTEDNFTADRIEGFTELGNTDKFTTAQLAERLSQKGIIDYEGVPLAIPGTIETSNRNNKDGKAIYESARQRMLDNMDDDDSFLDTTDDDAD